MTGIHRHLHGIQASGFVPVGTYNYTFTGSVNNQDLSTVLQADGWDGTTPKKFNITINSGVVIGSTSTASPGLTVGASWPARTNITIDNNGTIGGRGGAGGAATAGGSGGTALKTLYALTFDNTGSTISGGGGGGGGGGYRSGAPTACSGGKTIVCLFGGTAAGGAGGLGYGNAAQAGGSGGASRTCAVYCVCTGCTCNAYAGTGGTGGAAGAVGNTGANGSGCTDSSGPWGGGAAGIGVDGDSYITWTATGTINGSRVN